MKNRFPFEDAKLVEIADKRYLLLQWNFSPLPNGSNWPQYSMQMEKSAAEQLIAWRDKEAAERAALEDFRAREAAKKPVLSPENLYKWTLNFWVAEKPYPKVRDAAKYFGVSPKDIVQTYKDYDGDGVFELNVGIRFGHGGYKTLPKNDWELEALPF